MGKATELLSFWSPLIIIMSVSIFKSEKNIHMKEFLAVSPGLSQYQDLIFLSKMYGLNPLLSMKRDPLSPAIRRIS